MDPFGINVSQMDMQGIGRDGGYDDFYNDETRQGRHAAPNLKRSFESAFIDTAHAALLASEEWRRLNSINVYEDQQKSLLSSGIPAGVLGDPRAGHPPHNLQAQPRQNSNDDSGSAVLPPPGFSFRSPYQVNVLSIEFDKESTGEARALELIVMATKSINDSSCELDACKAIEALKVLNVQPDAECRNAFIKASIRHDDLRRALSTYQEMLQLNMEVSMDSVNAIFAACLKHNELRTAKKLFSSMTESTTGPRPTADTYTTMIEVFFASNDATGAHELINVMFKDGIKVKAQTYSKLVDLLVEGSSPHAAEAYEVFQMMREIGAVAPNTTYNNLAVACASLDEDPEAAREVVKEMRVRGVKPEPRTFSALLGLCLRTGDLTGARQLFSMIRQQRTTSRDAYVKYMELLRAAAPSDMHRTLVEVYSEMRERFPGPNQGQMDDDMYVCLVTACCALSPARLPLALTILTEMSALRIGDIGALLGNIQAALCSRRAWAQRGQTLGAVKDSFLVAAASCDTLFTHTFLKACSLTPEEVTTCLGRWSEDFVTLTGRPASPGSFVPFIDAATVGRITDSTSFAMVFDPSAARSLVDNETRKRFVYLMSSQSKGGKRAVVLMPAVTVSVLLGPADLPARRHCGSLFRDHKWMTLLPFSDTVETIFTVVGSQTSDEDGGMDVPASTDHPIGIPMAVDENVPQQPTDGMNAAGEVPVTDILLEWVKRFRTHFKQVFLVTESPEVKDAATKANVMTVTVKKILGSKV